MWCIDTRIPSINRYLFCNHVVYDWHGIVIMEKPGFSKP
jgi:hypothetical protein